MSETAIYYTLAQISRALSRRRQSIDRALAGIPADGCVIITGRNVNAWSLAALPVVLQHDLDAIATRRGFRNALALLSAPSVEWTPAVPLAECAPAAVAKAAKLQRALSRYLAKRNDTDARAGALEQMAVEDYRREFGHAVTPRAIRAMIARTLQRDGGTENFDRLELYLSEQPARKIAPAPATAPAEWKPLFALIASFIDPATPNLREKSHLWLRAFELYEQCLANGRPEKKIRVSLIKFLYRHAPALASSADSVRVLFRLKYRRWTECGRNALALADARADWSGNCAETEIPLADLDKLTEHAVFNHGGRVAPAWRDLRRNGQISEEIAGQFLDNPARKSYVPARVSEAVKYEVAALDDIHHGPRQAKLNGAHISRDWSGVHAMDWMQADDVTFPVYFSAPDGNGWYELTRGQVLLMIDVRSTCILGYVLISAKNYNAHAIRTLITKTCDTHGLPRYGFYFERGVWEKSALLKGSASSGPMSWGETEQGLREFGLEFKHSNLPRSKPVERVLGALQNLMEGLPGYVGRNEMVEKFERVQKLKREVENRKLDPAGLFLTEDQWNDKLDELCRAYNADPHDAGSKLTGGLSPEDAFERYQNADDPPVKFPAACRYLLASHKRPTRVTANGITLHFGKNRFNYRDGQTGALIGREVLAWFDPENPDTLAVTDMNRQNPFCVARSPDVDAMSASADDMAAAQERIGQHHKPILARYRILAARRRPQFRHVIADAETVERGETFDRARADIDATRRQGERQASAVRQAAREIGMPVPARRLQDEQSADGLRELAEWLSGEKKTP